MAQSLFALLADVPGTGFVDSIDHHSQREAVTDSFGQGFCWDKRNKQQVSLCPLQEPWKSESSCVPDFLRLKQVIFHLFSMPLQIANSCFQLQGSTFDGSMPAPPSKCMLLVNCSFPWAASAGQRNASSTCVQKDSLFFHPSVSSSFPMTLPIDAKSSTNLSEKIMFNSLRAQ